MSFLDNVVGAVTGTGAGDGEGTPGVMQAAMALIQQHGGLQGLVDKLQAGGLGSEVQSWIGSGSNLPISADTLQQVLGSGMVQQLAGKFGIDPDHLSQGLASVLPHLVDTATPDGTVTSHSGDLLQQGMGLLGGLLGGSRPA
jgi:Uncharacterized protein conserved in bacteria